MLYSHGRIYDEWEGGLFNGLVLLLTKLFY